MKAAGMKSALSVAFAVIIAFIEGISCKNSPTVLRNELEVSNARCIVSDQNEEKKNEMAQVIGPVKSGEKYYWFYYVGSLTHVPLQNNVAAFYYNGVKGFTKKLKTTKTNETGVARTIKNVASNSISTTVFQEFCLKYNKKLGVSIGIDDLSLDVSEEIGAAYKNGRSITATASNTFSVEDTASATQSESTTDET